MVALVVSYLLLPYGVNIDLHRDQTTERMVCSAGLIPVR